MNNKLKILVVDDEDMMRITMSAILSDIGGEVKEAADGYQAIELVKKHKFNIIFMDIKMPGINGVDTYLEIKKINPTAAVIMMTAYSVKDLIEKAINHGAYAVVYKPFDIPKIIEIIDNLYKPVILITDDETTAREMLHTSLIDEGFNVNLAENGKQAIEKVKNNGNIDIILLDIKMPEIDGIKTFEQIKKINSKISVIMMTGYSVEQMVKRAIEMGAYTCIYKPFDIEKIIEIIKQIRKNA